MNDAKKAIANFANDVVLCKTRHYIKHNNNVWHVDVFHGKLEGLILAEIEKDSVEEVMNVKLPEWVGKEVTNDVEAHGQRCSCFKTLIMTRSKIWILPM